MRDNEDGEGAHRQLLSKLLQWLPVARLRYEPQFIGSILRVYGIREGVAFMQKLNAMFLEMGSRYGTVLGSLVLSISASFNGCRFCGVGHLYAANVDHFRATGKLFPLDERELVELHKLPFNEVKQSILQHLSEPEFVEARRVVERIFALRMGQPTESDEDRVLKHALDLWNALAECTLGFSFTADAAELAPIVLQPTPMKEIRRYRAARDAQRKRAAS